MDQQLYRQQEAQNYDDWEALFRSPHIWWPYNVPGSHHTFPGTQHLAVAHPNTFYANCYSPREPRPFTPHLDLVTPQAPSGTPGSRTVGRHCPFTPNYVANLEPHAADSFTGVETSTRLLTVPRLNTSLPLHRFNPYRRPDRDAQEHDRIITSHDAVQASRNSTPLNLDMAGPSHSVTVTPPPLPSRLGLSSLPRLLLQSREHFTRFLFNDSYGFLMNADTLKGHARHSLETTFGQNNRKCLELLDINS